MIFQEGFMEPQVPPGELSRTIHIIDDERAVRDALGLRLRIEGYLVRVYDCGRAFLDEFHRAESGCVVTDVRMPGMSGLDLLKVMKARGISLPAIVVTGHADIPLAVQAMREGAFDFIEKPFECAALVASVQMAVLHDDERKARDAQIRMIEERRATLTPRESEVLAHVLNGRLSKVIAHELGVSRRCVEVHRAHVMSKMRVRNLPELVQLALIVPAMRESSESDPFLAAAGEPHRDGGSRECEPNPENDSVAA